MKCRNKLMNDIITWFLPFDMKFEVVAAVFTLMLLSLFC